MKNNLIIPSLLLSLAVFGSALLGSFAWQSHLKARQTLTVVGSSKIDFRSNLGFLRGTISAAGRTTGEAFLALQKQRPSVEDFFVENGIAKERVVFTPPRLNVIERYDENGRSSGEVIRYDYHQSFETSLDDVEKIAKLSLSLPQLVEKGVFLTVENPSYLFTDLAELKVEVQSLAAKDAMERARKIAEATGSSLGTIQKARMGVLQITPRHSTLVSDYGVNDTTSIEKEITAVVSATFQIR